MGLLKTGIQLAGGFAIAKTAANAVAKHDQEKTSRIQYPEPFAPQVPRQRYQEYQPGERQQQYHASSNGGNYYHSPNPYQPSQFPASGAIGHTFDRGHTQGYSSDQSRSQAYAEPAYQQPMRQALPAYKS